jgi:hypothetical protein
VRRKRVCFKQRLAVDGSHNYQINISSYQPTLVNTIIRLTFDVGLWDATPCGSVLRGDILPPFSGLKVAEVCSCETLVPNYKSTQRHITEINHR